MMHVLAILILTIMIPVAISLAVNEWERRQ